MPRGRARSDKERRAMHARLNKARSKKSRQVRSSPRAFLESQIYKGLKSDDPLQKDRALSNLVTINEGLVHSIAFGHQHRGVDLEDLVQQGRIGILRAAQDWDPKKGRFSTYATPWIRQQMLQSIQERTGELGTGGTDYWMARRAERMAGQFETRLGRTPREEELAYMLQVRPERLRRAKEANPQIVSLDAPLRRAWGMGDSFDDEEAPRRLGDIVSNEDRLARLEVDEKAPGAALFERGFLGKMGRLTPTEQEVIYQRYENRKQPAAIARGLGVSRARVSQIEKSAMEKINAPQPSTWSRLKGLLNRLRRKKKTK